MKKTLFSIIVVLLLTSIVPASKSETLSSTNSKTIIHLLLGKGESSSARSERIRKRTIKKLVRKVARVYRKGKTDRKSIKKSRKIQRNAKRIINIF